MPASPEQLELPADPRELVTARRFADHPAARFGLDEPDRYEFTFAANEAVSNAIEHGEPSPEGTIRLRFAEEGDALVFCVQDYGEFTPSGTVHGELGARGRGLAFMATMVDELDLCRGSTGTRVRLRKRREPGPCSFVAC